MEPKAPKAPKTCVVSNLRKLEEDEKDGQRWKELGDLLDVNAGNWHGCRCRRGDGHLPFCVGTEMRAQSVTARALKVLVHMCEGAGEE